MLYEADFFIYTLITSCPKLLHLELNYCSVADFFIYTLITSCPKLLHLELKYCSVSNDCFDTLMEYGQNLQYLSLFKTYITNGVGQICKLKNLKHFYFVGDSHGVTEIDSEDLIFFAYNLENLESLKIYGVSMLQFL